MSFKKPVGLCPGDTVGIVSPSWGGPAAFPAVYERGLKTLRDWGLKIREFPSARKDAAFLRANPRFRADDINAAFSDPEIKAVVASIGGNDSVRTLPFLDRRLIAANPKILLGYSDTTALHMFLSLNGLVSFYGPSVMAGLSQAGSLPPAFGSHVRKMLFEPESRYAYAPYGEYSEGYPDWGAPENAGKINPPRRSGGWRWLQGEGVVSGELAGGCLEVLEMLKGTDFWPEKSFWKGKILFLETSEDKPPLWYVDQALRNYGMMGALDALAGLIVGRPMKYSDEEKLGLERTLQRVVAGEFGRANMPIVTDFDAGHTDPQLILPFGVRASVDCTSKKIELAEPWLG